MTHVQPAAAGWQTVLDLYECDAPEINNVDWIRQTLLVAAAKAQATVVANSFHTFEPHGVSGVVVIAESHIAIHTWPERRYAAVDVFTCNSKLHVDKAVDYLTQAFRAKEVYLASFTRGDRRLAAEPVLAHVASHAA